MICSGISVPFAATWCTAQARPGACTSSTSPGRPGSTQRLEQNLPSLSVVKCRNTPSRGGNEATTVASRTGRPNGLRTVPEIATPGFITWTLENASLPGRGRERARDVFGVAHLHPETVLPKHPGRQGNRSPAPLIIRRRNRARAVRARVDLGPDSGELIDHRKDTSSRNRSALFIRTTPPIASAPRGLLAGRRCR